MISDKFKDELETLLNKHSIDNDCNIPDYILAQYLAEHLETLSRLNAKRDEWFGFKPFNGQNVGET